MFHRTVKGKLPILHKRNIVNRHQEAWKSEISKKEYHKQYAESRRNVTKCDIKVGDCVLVRQQKRDKLTPYFSEVPYTVSRITAQNKNGHSITRNISHFKPIQMDNTGDTDDNYECPTVITNNNTNIDEPIVRRSSGSTRIPERCGHPISWTISFKKGK